MTVWAKVLMSKGFTIQLASLFLLASYPLSIATARSRETPRYESWDVIVVGAGAAGLYTALCLPAEYRVLLLTKDELRLSASDWAQGGIAAAINPQDSPNLHIDDTLVAGAGLCEPEAVSYLVRQAGVCIDSLVSLGVGFDRKGEELAMTREAAHSRPRVLHAADRTGRAVVTTLAEKVLQRSNIEVRAQAFILQLWLNDVGACQGVALACQGQVQWLKSGAVVLATGGGGQVFSQTTNPRLSTGDGVAIAHRAGAQLRDLEFFQFHPTALNAPGAPRCLISEAVRGEGAHLVDDEGRRFAFDYHPDGELAPRDVVSRAIFQHLQKTGRDHVWLDMRPIDVEQMNRRFPNILRVCRRWGIEPLEQPIPVSPAAHYWMGGVTTDLQGQTSVPGLYAVGETASTGVHGANRLASNSLLECIVFGRELAQLKLPPRGAAEEAVSGHDVTGAHPVGEESEVDDPCLFVSDAEIPALLEDLARRRCQLAESLWQGAGICREQVGLDVSINQLKTWRESFDALPLSRQLRQLKPGQSLDLGDLDSIRWAELLRAWGELDNLLMVGWLILKSAAFRQESRGGHYRLDFPGTEAPWQVHTLIDLVDDEAQWQRSPVANS